MYILVCMCIYTYICVYTYIYIYIYIYIFVGAMRSSAHVWWAVTFIPMPMPKTVCRTHVYNKWVQQEVRRTLFGQGYGYEYHSSFGSA